MFSAQVQKLPGQQGSGLRGEILFERGVGVNRAETRRRDRWRWIGLVVGGVASVPPMVAISLGWVTKGPALLLLVPPAVIGIVLALFSATAFANADYWSDVVVVTYRGTIPGKVGPYHAMEAVGDYDVQIQIVRALSEDWTLSLPYGRQIRASVPEPGADDVYEAIRSALLTSPSGELRPPALGSS